MRAGAFLFYVITDLRLPRFTSNFCDLHRRLPQGAWVVGVRFTRATMIATIHAPRATAPTDNPLVPDNAAYPTDPKRP